MADRLPLFTKNYLPSEPGTWLPYRKIGITYALRIEGPFRVETSESENEPFFCKDGYLALDSRDIPYAIAKEEFEQIYERIGFLDEWFGAIAKEEFEQIYERV